MEDKCCAVTQDYPMFKLSNWIAKLETRDKHKLNVCIMKASYTE